MADSVKFVQFIQLDENHWIVKKVDCDIFLDYICLFVVRVPGVIPSFSLILYVILFHILGFPVTINEVVGR